MTNSLSCAILTGLLAFDRKHAHKPFIRQIQYQRQPVQVDSTAEKASLGIESEVDGPSSNTIETR